MTSSDAMRDDSSLLAQNVPRLGSREGRVRAISAVAAALVQGLAPMRADAVFVGSVLSAWLEQGGPFERHARISARRGSHRTAQALFRSVIADEVANVKTSVTLPDCNQEGES